MLSEVVTVANRDVESIASTEAIPAFIVLLILFAPVALVVVRRRGWQPAFELFVGYATVALIASVTLFRGELGWSLDPGGLANWGDEGLATLTRDPLSSSQFMLNVALFVPAGAALTWLTRRPGLTLFGLFAGSLAIECFQAVTGAGANDLVDLAANCTGALIGTGIALTVIKSTDGWQLGRSSRRRIQLLGGLAVTVLALSIGWFVGASQRQAHVRSVLEERFGGTDLDFITDLIDKDAQSVFVVDGIRGDGGKFEDRVELRYPATFFSLHRCVSVIWTSDDMQIRNGSGNDCTRLIV